MKPMTDDIVIAFLAGLVLLLIGIAAKHLNVSLPSL